MSRAGRACGGGFEPTFIRSCVSITASRITGDQAHKFSGFYFCLKMFKFKNVLLRSSTYSTTTNLGFYRLLHCGQCGALCVYTSNSISNEDETLKNEGTQDFPLAAPHCTKTNQATQETQAATKPSHTKTNRKKGQGLLYHLDCYYI